MLYIPLLEQGNIMSNLNLRIKLNKADIVQSTHLNSAKYHNKEGLEHTPPKRSLKLSIKGSVKNLLADTDLIVFGESESASMDNYQNNVADNIAINISVFDKDDKNLLLEPYMSIHDRTLYIGNLNFSFEQFEFIKNIIDDRFTMINLNLVRSVSKDEILESKERNMGHVIGIDYDLDNLSYSTERKKVDGEDLKILFIKHGIDSVKVDSFNASSSKPKYIKKDAWLSDVESIEDKEQEAQEQAEYNKIYASEGNSQQNTADLNGGNKTNAALLIWMKVLAILLVILIFKI